MIGEDDNKITKISKIVWSESLHFNGKAMTKCSCMYVDIQNREVNNV
jgi:hypothetical protein